MQMSGYVYILTNPSFKDDWVKIGKSSRPVDVRSKELDNTAVPLPFKIYAIMKTDKYNEAEHQIHSLIDLVNPSMRIRKGREFFNVTPEKALSIFQQCALTLDDAEITVIDHQNDTAKVASSAEEPFIPVIQSYVTPHGASQSKAGRLTFSMLHIPIGAELTFAENPSVKAYVANDDNLIMLRDGTRATLSKAVAIVKRQLGTATPSEAYQGGAYWLYKGERLTSIRNRLEMLSQSSHNI